MKVHKKEETKRKSLELNMGEIVILATNYAGMKFKH